jgi:allantoin racemase
MTTAETHILVVNPVTETRYEERTRAELQEVCPADVSFTVVSIAEGPAAIESPEDEQNAVAGIVARAVEWRSRCDAIVNNCFGDPGLRRVREAADVPVVGPGQASYHLAAQLGDRLAVVTVTDGVVEMLRGVADAAGVRDRLTSVRTSGLHVAELEGPAAAERVADECVAAVTEDHADVVILGCTGMAELAAVAKARLEASCPGVPLVVPGTAAFLTAYALARTCPAM